MAYTRYTKSNGSLRLVIDRMSLIICVICLVLSLVLAFAGGYLAGFNSRVSLVAAAQRQQVARVVRVGAHGAGRRIARARAPRSAVRRCLTAAAGA